MKVAFTIKELRELTKLPGCYSVLNPKDFDVVRNSLASKFVVNVCLVHFAVQNHHKNP